MHNRKKRTDQTTEGQKRTLERRFRCSCRYEWNLDIQFWITYFAEDILTSSLVQRTTLQISALSERSDKDNIQLFRASVKERQKQLLKTSLKSLESAALTARSGTDEEAKLRKDEADLILQWIDRAKDIQPLGQVVIAQSETKEELLLENGDILNVPTKDGLVLVSGEVLFPNAIAYGSKLSLDDYVKKAGGYTQNADSARIVVARRDGSFAEANGDRGFFQLTNNLPPIQAGDEILVLPKVDVKSRQFFKELTQIVYQIAVSARIIWKL